MNYATFKVLLVDDLGLARERTRTSLIALGFDGKHIDEAANGREALEMLRRGAADGRTYDLVVSDWNMPEMTGLDLLKACRADTNLHRIKFMMVSSESEQGSIVEALQAGANEYAIKPVSKDDLASKLQNVLGAA